MRHGVLVKKRARKKRRCERGKKRPGSGAKKRTSGIDKRGSRRAFYLPFKRKKVSSLTTYLRVSCPAVKSHKARVISKVAASSPTAEGFKHRRVYAYVNIDIPHQLRVQAYLSHRSKRDWAGKSYPDWVDAPPLGHVW
jgi:hypothetical protein